MESAKKLKVALFEEWSYDPPGGSVTIYYLASGTRYRDLLDPVTEIYEHLSHSVYDDEEEELEAACESVKGSRNSITNFNWDNGGVGCGCDFLAEGDEIVQKLIDLYYDELEDCVDEEETEVAEEILDLATKKPDDYCAVSDFIDFISELIEKRNEAQY